MANPLLDLSTLTDEERPTVKIDGTLYPFKRVDELPALSHDWVLRTGAWFETFKNRDDVTEAEEIEVDARLRRLVRLVLMAPSEVVDRLKPIHVLAVCITFSQLLTNAPTAGAGAAPTSRSTGAKSSRRSSGSMAATRGGGSRRSRLAS